MQRLSSSSNPKTARIPRRKERTILPMTAMTTTRIMAEVDLGAQYWPVLKQPLQRPQRPILHKGKLRLLLRLQMS